MNNLPQLPDHGQLQTERGILRILWDHPEELLVRSEIHNRMPRSTRPTLGRVGQILTALKAADLLRSEKRRAQGSRQAAFYQLSAQGLELCRQLGFERQDTLLFPVAKADLQRLLARERLAQPPGIPGRIASLWAYRGGLGVTTTTANVAWGLAKRLGEKKPVLILDLDLGAPGLDSSFKPPADCRGLAGMVVDFQRQPQRKRDLWVNSALGSPQYVHHPFPEDAPGLVYLPAGLNPEHPALAPTERAEALDLLNVEAVGNPRADGFLGRLRQSILDRFEKTLIDTQTGRCLSSWIATQVLADELVLCVRMKDEASTTTAGLRAVLASFLKRTEGEVPARVVPLFLEPKPEGAKTFDRWIDRNLIRDHDSPADPPNYHAEQIIYDRRLASQVFPGSGTSQFYLTLTARLGGFVETVRPTTSLTLKLLSEVLNPENSKKRRELAAGALSTIPLRDLAWLLEWHDKDRDLRKETDQKGHELIDDIIKGHSRRLRAAILPPWGGK